MVEYYYLAEKTVSKKVKKDHPMYPFMVCALYGLLSKYEGYEGIIIPLFGKTDIIFEKGNVKDILEKYNLGEDLVDFVHDDGSTHASTRGVSNQGHVFITDETGEVHYRKDRPFVACSISNTNMSMLLNTFCHEMGHLIKGEVNGFYHEKDKDNDVYVIRNGISHYVYNYRKNYTELEFAQSFAILDEAINCIHTTEVMNEIIGLKDIVVDERILTFLEGLDEEYLKEDHGYEDICMLVRFFYEHPTYRNSIEDNIVVGNIDNIVDDFDSIMGKGSFENVSMIIDKLYHLPEDCPEDEFNEQIDSFVKYTKAYSERVKDLEKAK